MREVVTPLFATTVGEGFVKLMAHLKHVTVVIEPVVGYLGHIAMARS